MEEKQLTAYRTIIVGKLNGMEKEYEFTIRRICEDEVRIHVENILIPLIKQNQAGIMHYDGTEYEIRKINTWD